MHLGCGETGVYAKKNNGKFTVAPGKYEFTGMGDETREIELESSLATCTELYVIAHFVACKNPPLVGLAD